MHFLYFVKIDRKEAETSREAINRAESVLANNGFIFSEGFWGGGKCDWFVMGGRWSGTLSGLAVKDDFILAAHKLIASKAKDTAERGYLSDAEVTEYADDIQKLWLNMGGTNANPYARNGYKADGLDDDAAVLTEDNIAALKSKYPEGVEYYDADAYEEKPLSSLSAEDIGDWLVVVDYHYKSGRRRC
jgi:hypothetical protein